MSPVTTNFEEGSMELPRVPHMFVHVPSALLSLGEDNLGFLCNARPSQRSPFFPNKEARDKWKRENFHGDGHWVEGMVKQYLKTLKPHSNVLLHYQDADEGIFTSVARTRAVEWDKLDDYPLLVLCEPRALALWGAYILAIGPAPRGETPFVIRDPHAEQIIRIIRTGDRR